MLTPESDPEAPASVIECRNLTKVYGDRATALRNVTLVIPRGASFGLLGENGAGKSTLVRLLMGFITPTTGTVSLLGETEVTRAHHRVGYVHERPLFEPRFSGREHLTYLAALSGLNGHSAATRIDEVLALVELSAVAGRHVGAYSKGMLQRLAIAQALLSDPELLILDEPTSGLDPLGQYEVRQIIAELHRRGKTILLCSHYLAEVEALCDTVGILHRGQLARSGAVAELLRLRDSVEITLAGDVSAAETVTRLGLGAQVSETDGARLHLAVADQPAVLSALLAAGVAIHALTPIGETLEDLYIRITSAPPASAATDEARVSSEAGTRGDAQ
jgi:ABC-2 type transport system ATP-binding protein